MGAGEWIGIVSAVVALLSGYSFFNYNHIKRDLEVDDNYRKKVIEQLQQPDFIKEYSERLKKLLAWVTGIWGEERWHVKGFLACFYFSFTYSILLFFFSWVLGASGKIGAMQFLPSDSSDWQRWALLSGLGVYVIFIVKESRKIFKPAKYRVPLASGIAIALSTYGGGACGFALGVAVVLTSSAVKTGVAAAGAGAMVGIGAFSLLFSLSQVVAVVVTIGLVLV